MNLKVKAAAARVAKRYRELQSLRKYIVERPGADPVLKGTEVSVYVIAALTQGQSIPEILEDYPSLTEKQVRQATAYASAYPKAGRPYPKRSFKRMASDLAATGVFDGDPREESFFSPSHFQ
jgi:uncharacterized protein (DUF433 family)